MKVKIAVSFFCGRQSSWICFSFFVGCFNFADSGELRQMLCTLFKQALNEGRVTRLKSRTCRNGCTKTLGFGMVDRCFCGLNLHGHIYCSDRALRRGPKLVGGKFYFQDPSGFRFSLRNNFSKLFVFIFYFWDADWMTSDKGPSDHRRDRNER